MRFNGDYVVLDEYPDYGIHRCGDVVILETGELVKMFTNEETGYFKLSLRNKNGKKILTSRHRLLALAYLGCPGIPDDMYVNHIDGIRGRDILENLEWVTPTQNVEHAGELGLSNKCTPIDVRDVRTGEILSFPSAKKAGDYFGVSKDLILWRIKSAGRIFPELRQYAKKGTIEDWNAAAREAEPSGVAYIRPVLVRDIRSGDELIFRSTTQAAGYIGVCGALLTKKLADPSHPVFHGLRQIKWFTDPNPWREPDDPYLELERNSDTKVIKRVNTLTSETKIYLSLTEAAEDNGLHKSTLFGRLKKKIEVDNILFTYYNNCSL